MRRQLLVTATGEDRPGIVARLSEVFVEHGANLEESRMALLGGEFAAIILVTVADQRMEALNKSLVQLMGEGITIATKPTKGFGADRLKGHVPFELKVSGADHEGIVHRVSKFLRDHAVNIQSMESEVLSAPETGTPLFSMRATVQVPPSVAISEFKKQLAEIGYQESVEIEVCVPGKS